MKPLFYRVECCEGCVYYNQGYCKKYLTNKGNETRVHTNGICDSFITKCYDLED